MYLVEQRGEGIALRQAILGSNLTAAKKIKPIYSGTEITNLIMMIKIQSVLDQCSDTATRPLLAKITAR